MSTLLKGQAYAVGSGLLAALASLCGKYAMASREAQDLCETTLNIFNEDYNMEIVNENERFCGQV